MVLRNIPSALRTIIDSPASALTSIWTIIRSDGVTHRYTSHDCDITIGGVTYKAAVGYERTASEKKSNLAVGGMDVRGIINSKRMTDNDLRAGRYDYADVEIVILDWTDPSNTEAILQTGKFGEVTYARREQMFETELRDLTQAYTQRIIESFTIPCRADYGDLRCNNAATGIVNRNPSPVWQDEIANNTAYALDDVVRVRVAREDVIHLHAPGVTDANDDSQFAATGTLGSDATAADATRVKNLAGAFRLNPVGGATQNPSNAFVSYPDSDNYDIGMRPFTMECWINLESINNDDDQEGGIIASKFDSSGNNREWFWGFVDRESSVPGFGFYAYTDGTNASLVASIIPFTTFEPQIDKFYHVAVTRDKYYRLRHWINGKLILSEDFPYDIHVGSSLFRLGMLQSGGGFNRHLDGWIEDFQFTSNHAKYTLDDFTPPGALASTLADPDDYVADFNDTNYRCTTAGTTHATLPFIFHSSQGPDADTGITTLSVTAPSTYTRASGSFIDDGFLVDMMIQGTGFTNADNNADRRIASVSALSIVVTSTALDSESGTGDERLVQINKSSTAVFTAEGAKRISGTVIESLGRETFTLVESEPAGLMPPSFAMLNAGFDVGSLAEWTQVEGTTAIVTSLFPFRPSWPHSGEGTYCVRNPSHWSGSSWATITQTKDMSGYASSIDVGDKTVRIDFWYWGDSGAAGTISINFDFLDEDDMIISSTTGTAHKNIFETWVAKSQTNNLPVGTRKVVVRCRGGGGTSEAYADTFSISTTAVDESFPDDIFNYGVATCEKGLNAGLSMDIQTFDKFAKTFVLYEKWPFPINPGDVIAVHHGCNREYSMCRDVHLNTDNNRGFRFIPGDGKYTRVPQTAG